MPLWHVLCWGWRRMLHCSPNPEWHSLPKALLWETGKKISKLFSSQTWGKRQENQSTCCQHSSACRSFKNIKKNLLPLPRKQSKKKRGLLLKPSHKLCQPPLHNGRGAKPFSWFVSPRFLHPLWFQPSKASLSSVYISTGTLWDKPTPKVQVRTSNLCRSNRLN